MDRNVKVKILDLMIEARCMEERMLKMSKSADGYFWLGGVGEEAFTAPLGMLARCRSRAEDPDHHYLDYDFFHFHYRNGATMLAMGMDPKDEIRQMNNRLTDPFSGGRNFCNHYSRRVWNVAPGTSTIQAQCSVAPGTALAQKRHGGEGLTIVTFGDAGTAEGDFHIGLNWATQPTPIIPGSEPGLPLLFVCTNNKYGISTDYTDVHGQDQIAHMAAGYGMPVRVIDGNCAETSYNAIQEAMEYVRKERKPYFLEAMVSRLNGHSSSSGANRVPTVDNPDDHKPGENELDPLLFWNKRLVTEGVVEADYLDAQFEEQKQRMSKILAEVRKEAEPQGEHIYDNIFAYEIPNRHPRNYE